MAEPLLTDRLDDLASQAEKRGWLTHTGFLTPAEQQTAAAWLKKRKVVHHFTGGFSGAERQVCLLLPTGSDPAVDAVDLADILAALRIDVPAGSPPLGHRDYLGSLLGLGLRRDQLGDILVGDCGASVLALQNAAAIIRSQLERVGAQPVRVSDMDLAAIEIPDRPVTLVRMTAASLRLDRIAADGFGVSRTRMAELIRTGIVSVNWQEEKRPDREVPIGSVISVRGLGRIRLQADEGLSRKGRHRLLIERYQER